MQGTLSREISIDIVQDYLLLGLGTFLIYRPDLGLTETPTPAELDLRYDLTMKEAVEYEVGGATLNGYMRHFINIPFVLYLEGPVTKIIFDTYFISVKRSMGPFTHICIATGMNTFGGGITNGNNRGDIRGSLIGVQPVPTITLPEIPDRPDILPGTIGKVLAPEEVYTDNIKLELKFY